MTKGESTANPDNFKSRYPDHTKPSVAEAVAFLIEVSARGPVTVVTIPAEGEHLGVRTRTFDTGDADSVDDMRSFIAAQESLPVQVFYVPNEVAPDCHGVPGNDDIASIRSIVLDFDPPKDMPLDAARDMLRGRVHDLLTGPLQPRILCDTGGGFQAVFQLIGKIPADSHTKETIELLMKSLARSLGADTATCTIKNLFRVPGTYNWPTPAKKRLGRERTVSGVWHHGGPRCTLEELRALASVRVEDGPKEASVEFGDLSEQDLVAVLLDPESLPARLLELCRDPAVVKALNRPPPLSDTSGGDFALACSLARMRMPPRDIAMLVSAYGHKVRAVFEQERLFTYIVGTVKKAVDQVSPELLLGDFEDDLDEEEAKERQQQHRERLQILSYSEVVENLFKDNNDYLVQGLLQRGDMAVIYGKSGAGKTFVTLDLAYHISLGLDWNGCKTNKTGVLYIAAESSGSIRRRCKALGDRFGASDSFFVIAATVNMFDINIDLKPLARNIKKLDADIGLIIIDTLARTMIGGNENSTQDMSRLVANGDLLRDTFNTAVLWVHHTGKNEAAGARGSSALRAATDVEVEVADYTLFSTKMRDSDPVNYRFQLPQVKIGTMPDGEVVTTCVVDWMQHTGPTGRATPETDTIRMAIDFLRRRGTPASVDDMWEDAALMGRPFPVKQKRYLATAMMRAYRNPVDGRFTCEFVAPRSGPHKVPIYGLVNW